MKKYVQKILPLYAAVLIPLTDSTGWQDLKFSRTSANKARYAKDGMRVEVNESASPLIYPLGKVIRVKAVRAQFEIDGQIHNEKDDMLGPDKFPNDAYFRVGLVIPGQRRLTWFEKMTAPAWIKKLFSLAPAETGIDHVAFFNIAAAPATIGAKREMKQAQRLIREQIIAIREPDQKKIVVDFALPEVIEAAAVWLSIDGDQTKSKFTAWVQSLELETAN